MINVDGKRDEWTFDYSISELLKGATAQRDFRAARLSWWKEKKEGVLARAEKSGLVINESVADEAARAGTYTMSMANMRQQHGTTFGVDPSIPKDFNECASKVAYHQQMFEVYDGWVQLLEKQPPGHRALIQADWLFFFGKVDPYL